VTGGWRKQHNEELHNLNSKTLKDRTTDNIQNVDIYVNGVVSNAKGNSEVLQRFTLHPLSCTTYEDYDLTYTDLERIS
jgi:hypothetical protein